MIKQHSHSLVSAYHLQLIGCVRSKWPCSREHGDWWECRDDRVRLKSYWLVTRNATEPKRFPEASSIVSYCLWCWSRSWGWFQSIQPLVWIDEEKNNMVTKLFTTTHLALIIQVRTLGWKGREVGWWTEVIQNNKGNVILKPTCPLVVAHMLTTQG